MKTDLDPLPAGRRRELERIMATLFEAATKNKRIATRRLGRVVKIVLFGSCACEGMVVDAGRV